MAFNLDFPQNEPVENFLLPVGYYVAVVGKAIEKHTQRGARMISYQLKVKSQVMDGAIKPGNLGTLNHNFVFPVLSDSEDKARYMLERIRLFLKLIGEPYKGEGVVVDSTRWVGKEVFFKVKHGEYNGETQAQIHYFLSVENALKVSGNQQKQDNLIDDINSEDLLF